MSDRKRVRRPPTAVRGYDSKWQKASVEYLKANPWCAFCLLRGTHTQATIVDHKVPHSRDWKLFWSRSNWQPLCALCHNGPKQAQEKSGTIRGCDEEGMPLDPGHHWR